MVGLTVPWRSAGNRLGCFSIALDTAAGNIAIAREYAMGRLAYAAHVNSTSTELVLPGWYVKGGEFIQRYSLWLNFVWILPLFIQSRIIAKQKASNATVSRSN